MKKVYERPVMMAEVYETNAYCGNCGAYLSTTLTTDVSQGARLSSTNNSGVWNYNSDFPSITSDKLSHTFTNNDISATIDGNCTSGCKDVSQSIWKCNCTNHPGQTWYLEYSHYYTAHVNNNKPTFFLYKEANDRSGLQILGFGAKNVWPEQQSGKDINVAQVIYASHDNTVVAS